MNQAEAMTAARQFQEELGVLLGRMREHKSHLILSASRGGWLAAAIYEGVEPIENINETIEQHRISIRDLESALLRQDMALKYIGSVAAEPAKHANDAKV